MLAIWLNAPASPPKPRKPNMTEDIANITA